jgi:hypothetical protein
MFPVMCNDCSLFVEKHMFKDGTHIRHSPVGIDEVSVSADVTEEGKLMRTKRDDANEQT